MDNEGLIPYGLILPITSFLVVLKGGFTQRLGGPAVRWCAVYALVHMPPVIAVPSAPVDLVWKLSFPFQYIACFGLCA